MSAGAPQPRARRRERRIIDRPRLIKLLDETEARTILIVAPAGYGKTILTRQWAKSLTAAACVTLSQAHRDVATLADDLATALRPGEEELRFVREYVRARGNPQREARAIGRVLAQLVAKQSTQWIVFDDYHELGDSPEATAVVEELLQVPATRFLVASRTRPAWATSRRIVYGDVAEIARDSLAMNTEESKRVLGRRPDAQDLIRQSEGWPAVLGLASSASAINAPGEALPAALYDYFAEELFRAVPEPARAKLTELALASDLSFAGLQARFGETAQQIVDEARELGFMSIGKTLELHPLLREFLLQKLAETSDVETAVRQAIDDAVVNENWDKAFELILRFRIHDKVESALETAYQPLVRSGRLGTLSSFSSVARAAPVFPPPIVELVEAEVALRDGEYRLAMDIAERVIARLTAIDPLRSRAHTIIGGSAWILNELEVSRQAYEQAHLSAQDESAEVEALYGWALASIQGELGDANQIVSALAKHRHRAPLDLLRNATAELIRQHFSEGFASGVSIEEGLHVLPQVEDPRARSSFFATASACVALRGEYTEALALMGRCVTEIDAFGLDFARPHALWGVAFIELGLRRFGACESSLQRLEDMMRGKPLDYHVLNARILRARLALQTGQLDIARELVGLPATESALPYIHGEYHAIRALVLAATGEHEVAVQEAREAEGLSTAVEVRVLAHAAIAAVAAQKGDDSAAADLWRLAGSLGTWDPLICACRASPALASAVSTVKNAKPRLAMLYRASNDHGLARRSGLRTRATATPAQILTPREFEVLELLARGFRNKDVAQALVISQSTTKVHVRHILEKLGVRSRSEAVARLRMFDS